MRVLGKVSYKGTNYFGWQKQNFYTTVQETIETVLSQILNGPINIYGSGRTDAGVHAKGQTFHFDLHKDFDLDRLLYSVNCLLPEDIYINSFTPVDDDFHARYSAKGKVYQYDIRFGHRDVFDTELVTTIPQPCDIELFKKALNMFVGEHCFKNFTSKEEDDRNFVRKIHEIQFQENNGVTSIILKGSGFMRYMIRFVVGTALAVSQGKESLEFIKNKLCDTEKRDISAYKAPSVGLYLIDVLY